jgi:hypothetical protein
MQKDRYLFRGKKQNGEWLQGDLVHYGDKILVFSENAQNSPDYYEVEPETVGQFTGLTDKKGVKIFEGDIDITGDIIDSNSLAMYVLVAIANEPDGIVANYIDELNEILEVCGNIHENPELLK